MTAFANRWSPLLAAFGIAVLAAACGGGSGSPQVASLGPTTTTTTQASANPGPPSYAAALKFANCMHAHGVTSFPDPGPASGGVRIQKVALPDNPQTNAATAACRKFLPKNVLSRPVITPQDQTDYLKAARCMRTHGIAGFPDPLFNNGSVSFPIPNTMNPNSKAFLQARAVCEKLIPNGLPYSH